MVETVGCQLRRARLARQLSLDDAARSTKIRAARLHDLENDIYTNFPNLAYARGFLTGYGKFLAVDVRPYLDAFEHTSTFGVDDYQYLSDQPVGVYRAPRRVWRKRASRGRLLALSSTLAITLMAVFGWIFYLNFLRLGDLSKLADSQDSRGGRPTAESFSQPIPTEKPAIPSAIVLPPAVIAKAELAPANTASVAMTAPAPAPTEMAMIDKPAIVVPTAVAVESVAAPAQPAPASPEMGAALVTNTAPPAAVISQPVPAAAHRVLSHDTRRVSFQNGPTASVSGPKSLD